MCLVFVLSRVQSWIAKVGQRVLEIYVLVLPGIRCSSPGLRRRAFLNTFCWRRVIATQQSEHGAVDAFKS